MGVADPSILWCSVHGADDLQESWPHEWGRAFALKPLTGFSELGIMLLERNSRGLMIDRFSGKRVRGRADVLSHMRRTVGKNRKIAQSTFYIETLIRADQRHYQLNATPPDFKYFMFGPKIGAIAALEGRKTDSACMAWFDSNWRRTDMHGCVCRNVMRLPASTMTCPPTPAARAPGSANLRLP